MGLDRGPHNRQAESAVTPVRADLAGLGWLQIQAFFSILYVKLNAVTLQREAVAAGFAVQIKQGLLVFDTIQVFA